MTLKTLTMTAVRLGVSPEINALSTILIAIVIASLVAKRNALRQRYDEQAAVWVQ